MAEHSPNTSEYSAPHTSEAHPEVHVDCLHFDNEGKHSHESSKYDVHGITDSGAVSMGKETHEWHQSRKEGSDSGK